MISLIRLIRYRFFIFAGMFPYLLGQAIAFHSQKSFIPENFYWGALGIFLVLAGVELFNEYFDAEAGGDRIFSIEKPPVPKHFYFLGLSAFALAFLIGLRLAFLSGWGVIAFSALGFLCAYFYVGPPLKWAYRGLGEIVIALSYGPLMVLGSFYIQANQISAAPLAASLLCGLSIFGLAILNEIPDYYQDKLIGKKNLVVRTGKRKAVTLLGFCYTAVFLFIALGIFLNYLPSLVMINFLILPWLIKCFLIIKNNYENPLMFRQAINANLVMYLVIVSSLILGYLI